MTGGGWVLLITKVINSGEAFCSFTLLYFLYFTYLTLLYWIEADANPGLLFLKKKEMRTAEDCGLKGEG